jgi:hypothetical protein
MIRACCVERGAPQPPQALAERPGGPGSNLGSTQLPASGIHRPAIPRSRIALRAETNAVAATATALVSWVFANSPITLRLAVSPTRATIGVGRPRLKTNLAQHQSVRDLYASADDSE